jgi:DNA-binding NarL/FixJ family response regulator
MDRIVKQKTIDSLAKRELEVFGYLAKGVRTKDIGEKLNLKPNTISTIKKVINRKLGVSNNMELFKIAQENNML